MEKKCKKAKSLSEEALQIAMKRREVKSKGEKERYKHLNAEFQRIARRDKKKKYHNVCHFDGFEKKKIIFSSISVYYLYLYMLFYHIEILGSVRT